MPLNLLDLVFPPACGGCGERGSLWCRGCAATLEPAPPAAIDGIPLIAAAALGGPLQRAIHTYKYRARPALGDQLAGHLLDSTRRFGIQLSALSFVPLHPSRQRQRGFNQAERLARRLGSALSLPVVEGLSRTRPTGPQVGLSGLEREVNVAGAFRWTAPGRPPLGTGLVDDVCTTGATLRAAATALSAAGGSVGAFLVLAVAHTLPLRLVTLPE